VVQKRITFQDHAEKGSFAKFATNNLRFANFNFIPAAFLDSFVVE
jgi:hypothetical protein